MLPFRISEFGNEKVEDVILGANHSFCLMRNGKVYGWGSSKDRKLAIA
jgi:alpha-tubulin suppressor-like RCC1 family protein